MILKMIGGLPWRQNYMIGVNSSIYDAYNCIIYSKNKDNIYCIDMVKKTKQLYCNCDDIANLVLLDY